MRRFTALFLVISLILISGEMIARENLSGIFKWEIRSCHPSSSPNSLSLSPHSIHLKHLLTEQSLQG